MPTSLPNEWMTPSKFKHRESTLWQRRYWEHQIQDEADYQRHVDYVHWNPVKHRIVDSVHEWPYSTFHRYVARGVYPEKWGGLEKDVVTGVYGE